MNFVYGVTMTSHNIVWFAIKLIFGAYSIYFIYTVIETGIWFYRKPRLFQKRVYLSLLRASGKLRMDIVTVVILGLLSVWLDVVMLSK